ncbi:DUF7283 family protein [Haloglomus litoreum]|uniref:DUF7283 family protein n=1 Tax=Haloglomus litoreum TaxID=3034026 RepID=UPI0023E831E2|nr:hypothetical protein [Haloglomus sp. DT116]
MLGTPADAWYVWLGLATVSLALLGTATSLPTAAPPDPAPAARTVDAVASGPYASTAEHPLDAAAVRIDPAGIALRTDGGAVREPFSYGPVTPVPPDAGDLRAVLTGGRPARAFETPQALADRAARARQHAPEWRAAPDQLLVRHVTWGDVDVTLVG